MQNGAQWPKHVTDDGNSPPLKPRQSGTAQGSEAMGIWEWCGLDLDTSFTKYFKSDLGFKENEIWSNYFLFLPPPPNQWNEIQRVKLLAYIQLRLEEQSLEAKTCNCFYNSLGLLWMPWKWVYRPGSYKNDMGETWLNINAVFWSRLTKQRMIRQ